MAQACTNQTPDREQYNRQHDGGLTAYGYDEIVATIERANAVNERYATLVCEVSAQFEGRHWTELIRDEKAQALSEITRGAVQVSVKGASRHSGEMYPLKRAEKAIRQLERTIEKLERIS